MGAHRSRGRRAALVLAIFSLGAAGLAAAPAAHALTPGPVTANEDDYTSDGLGAFTYTTTGSYSVDAAHGVLVNDSGPVGTIVDLPDTVDDYTSSPHIVTTDQGFSVKIFADGSFKYCVGQFVSTKCVPDPSYGPNFDQVYSGTDSFIYYIMDPKNPDDTDLNSVLLTIAPVLQNDTYQLNGGSLDIAAPGVTANDAGVDPSTLTFDVESAQGGTIVDNGNGAFTYTPPESFTGVDSFMYDVFDLDADIDYHGTVSISIFTDTVAPTVAMTQPTGSISLSPNIPVSWSGSDTGGSLFSHFDVEAQGAPWNGAYGAWSAWKMNTGETSASFAGTYGRSYCFRVHAVDNAGNASPWATHCVSVPLRAGNVSYSTGWHKSTSSAYFGGFAYYTTTAGARATRSSIDAKHVWLIATENSKSGTVKVYWNNHYVRTINLYHATSLHRKPVALLSFSSPQHGTLVLLASSKSKFVVLEGLDIFQS